MYSQNKEEKYILEYFKDYPTGNFVDIGAYDVFRFSNTRALYEKGWSGILVEPAPKNFKAIEDHYKNEPRIKVLNVAIGDSFGDIEFYESDGDAVGTTDPDHRDKWAAGGVNYETITVPQIPASELFAEHVGDCDFLSIDTEGTNMKVFRSIPDYVWMMVKMVCVEHDREIFEIQTKLQEFGFKTLYTNAENIILAK